MFILSGEEKKKILEEISAFYLDVRGEEIGIIERQQILELFLENLAPLVYNKALDDTFRLYQRMQENMEADFYSLYQDR